jgi:hypothetical protein
MSRVQPALALCLASVLSCIPLFAQTPADSQITISTDRPSVANSSVVVPKGVFQMENGLLVTNTSGQSVVDLPESSLRFGLLDRTELRLAAPDYFFNLPAGTSQTSGFGDLALGLKQQLGPFHKDFDLSVIFFLSFPTGASAVSSHGYDPGLQFPWSWKLTSKWTMAGQIAFYWPTLAGKHTFTGEPTVYFDRQLTDRWDAFAEYAGDFPDHGGPRHLLHFGTSFKLAPHHQIDLHGAVGLSGAAPDNFVGVGYSFLIRAIK